MKKTTLFFLLLILLSLWTFSCQKEEENAPIAPNEATIANLTKEMQNGILTIRVGHSAKNCKGCVIDEDGQNVRIECSGYGTLREITARVSIIDNGLNTTVYSYGFILFRRSLLRKQLTNPCRFSQFCLQTSQNWEKW